MTELPATFLFTDVQGSTRLLKPKGEHYAEALGHLLVFTDEQV
jgi:hypothetical protein